MKSVLELNDDIREDILIKERLISYYQLKQEVDRIRYVQCILGSGRKPCLQERD